MTLNVKEFDDQVLEHVNSQLRRTGVAPVIAVACVVIAGGLWCARYYAAGVVVLGLGLVGALVAYQTDTKKRTSRVHYGLAPELSARFSEIQRAVKALASANGVWHIVTEEPDWSTARGGNIRVVVNRSVVRVERVAPRFIDIDNVETWGIDLGEIALYFLPDRLLVWRGKRYGTISYEGLEVVFSYSQFIEQGEVPEDARVLEYVWQHARKDGGPDRRFSENRRIPLVQYGDVTLSSTGAGGLDLRLHVSNASCAERFVEIMRGVGGWARGKHRPRSEQAESQGRQRAPALGTTSPSAYEILQIQPGCSGNEIRAAYHRLAKMYHPDQVRNLGPEFRELAERRMKEINVAYAQLEHLCNQLGSAGGE